MWGLDNRTAYAAGRNWIRDKHGTHYWVVSVRATFDVPLSGRPRLADEQCPPALAPKYFEKPGVSSLRWDSDLLWKKPCCDVVANATAYAPRGRPVERVVTSLRVGSVARELHVYGTRIFHRRLAGGVELSAPARFTSQAVRYEHAFGGQDLRAPDPRHHRIDLRNPLGRGFATRREHLLDTEGPTVVAPESYDTPAGFGAIDASWSPRREQAGTYDARWADTKRPFLPDDFDDLYGASAPVPQQATDLRGGEPVELLNLTPDGAMRFELPRIYLAFTTHFGRRRVEHRSRLTTVLLEPDTRTLSLVWQTSIPVDARDGEYLDVTTVHEKAYVR